MTARRHNITGIERLSIGKTTNSKGNTLRRYSITVPANERIGPSSERTEPLFKSFYFGANTTQHSAFIAAVRWMKEQRLYRGTLNDAKNIYNEYQHETLLD